MKEIESNWLAQHPEIDQQYRGEYIAISGEQVVAHGHNLKEVVVFPVICPVICDALNWKSARFATSTRWEYEETKEVPPRKRL